MSLETSDSGLNQVNLGHLKYLAGLAAQPAGSWNGFYRTPVEGMNFGLRFQIAFSGYALFGLARLTPAYRAVYTTGLAALIEKMAHPDTWAYWFRGAARSLAQAGAETKPAGSLRTALEFTHSRLGLGGAIPLDPCQQGNIQYSAHLASLLGFYEMLSGDDRFDQEGLTLTAQANGQSFSFKYTHTSLAERIHQQMQDSHFGGACCEPGRAYAACNNHACISNLLHDRLHGTHLAEVNLRWAEWIKNRMLTGGMKGGLPLPAPNGLLSVAYMPDLHLPIPVSFNLTDAWGLSFMAAWDPDTASKIYPRFRKRLKKGPHNSLYLGSVRPNESAEISSVGLNTAFAAVFAREMGDRATFERLLAWADQQLDSATGENGECYYQAKPAAYITALLALAQALPGGGGGLRSLLAWQPDFEAPYLAEVSGGVDVTAAEWDGQALKIRLEGTPGAPAELKFGNLAFQPEVIVQGIKVETNKEGLESDSGEGELTLKLALPAGATEIILSQL
ncbi:MAG: hypothetical protein JWP00_4315 [Chloroflexi bacterium]|nr:hypothetical protein [Chloroflexota bacterium]